MRAHVIEREKIVNTIEIERLDLVPELRLIDASLGGKIGDRVVDGVVIPSANPIPPARVPMLNAHLVLIDAGWMPALRAHLDAMPGIEGEKARAYFAQALTLSRDHPLVQSIPAALGKTEAEVDALFIAAGELNV